MRTKYDWIAFFDIDEFLDLDSKYNSNVKNFLNEPMFNHCNCIRVCWQNYDDNDFRTQALKLRENLNGVIKTKNINI